ncbi:MAG: hypothetical protein JRI23_12590 [Deltaproteobacteria bacterium]|jgi:cytochrome c5|nr:hypothetical protein [Deltaproteobacteria bacterium]MBW2532554.1 hypothetical protein [Deltaproteobacteria bacterium]
MKTDTAVLALALAGAGMWACGTSTPAPVDVPPDEATSPSVASAEEPATPAAPEPKASALTAEELLEERCAACHGLDRLEGDIATDRWPAIVEEMINKGAKLDGAEKKLLLDHLASR